MVYACIFFCLCINIQLFFFFHLENVLTSKNTDIKTKKTNKNSDTSPISTVIAIMLSFKTAIHYYELVLNVMYILAPAFELIID